MASTLETTFKYYRGTLSEFKAWLATKSASYKLDLMNYIVFIHKIDTETSTEDDINTGWIYAHGQYYTASSTSYTVNIDAEGYVKIVNKDKKLVVTLDGDKILKGGDSTDPENEYLVTKGYLEDKLSFDNLN